MESEPSKYILPMLWVTGLVRREEDGRPWWRLATILTALNVIALAFGVDYYILEDHPFLDKVFSYEVAISSAFLCSKLVRVGVLSRRVLELALRSDSVWADMARDPANHPILLQERKRMKRILKCLAVPYLGPVPLSFALYFLTTDQSEPMFKFSDPVVLFLGEDYFMSRIVIQTIVTFYSMVLYGFTVFIILFFCLMAATQMKVLSRMLDSGCPDMRACVRLHQHCTKFVKDVNDLFSGVMAIELLGNALVISLRSYVVILLMKNGDPRFVGEIIFLSSCFTDPFLLCYGGQIITDMSEEVYRRSYQGQWYDLSNSERRSLALLMTRATRPLGVSWRRIISFDMLRYASVFQAAYSYITILIGM